MVYIFGILGFITGFAIGLGAINVMLRHYSAKEIQKNRSFAWTYGVAVWIFAGCGAWLGIITYNRFFY